MTAQVLNSRSLPTIAGAVALMSAAAIAYQLLLMRWLAIVHWYPFAAMIISLALLGHGASGTWLSVWLYRRTQAWFESRFEHVFAWCASLFAVTAEAARFFPFCAEPWSEGRVLGDRQKPRGAWRTPRLRL